MSISISLRVPVYLIRLRGYSSASLMSGERLFFSGSFYPLQQPLYWRWSFHWCGCWYPRVWLHNLLLVLMLVSMATVFGVMFSPWTIIAIMLAVSIYDYFAVRYGYMQWMAKKAVRKRKSCPHSLSRSMLLIGKPILKSSM